MIFSSPLYLVFLAIVFISFWLVPARFKKPVLLVASYGFYMNWLPAYGILLFLLTLGNFGLGLALAKYRKNKPILWTALAFNVGALCYYKYANFLISAFVDLTKGIFHLAGAVSPIAQSPVLNIILPLGISFFTFEFIHYIVDIYRGGPCISKPLDFFVFASFFPSQISGPIKRYQDFDKQLNLQKVLQKEDVLEGLRFLLQGLFKKVAIADNLAPVSAWGANHVTSLGSLDAWIVMVAFVIQMYYDFSGYTDMGIGSARLLGIRIPNNFNLPYTASRNMIEFWQRWHITLSLWLRDYLLTPMTGFRASKTRFHIATMITMTACGLWHGAAWHFVAWGFLHGVVLCVTREYQQLITKFPWLRGIHSQKFAQPVACACTLLTWTLLASFFLCRSTSDALAMLGHMFSYAPSAEVSVFFIGMIALLVLVSMPIGFLRENNWLKGMPGSAKVAYCMFLVFILIGMATFAPTGPQPFIYFQF